ncbi:MAG: pyrroline-5-carboxylate reductase [Haliea sp.]|jgi:pyrroline-5-carboxylate reductase|uniref:pyrroline-5-carboxylate reductase n=1 Tax=Haliea sp. TaxID=1932666 RepID=UPI000C465730|nr:pyrroline-5-carboxylate reductase [Haliea sp.]MBM68878.1 pyrroline-5-carboxylate reductase [Haliea sp.]|tara:strand:- start:73427 stop:74260 length:834 start_codon:yes stop_codon:yes gene_type:complete
MTNAVIAFIGAGNMASSIIGGLLESGHPATRLHAADPSAESLSNLRKLGPVHTYQDNAEACAHADVVIVAVKPQVMRAALESIAAPVRERGALVISIAAGTTIASMEQSLGTGAAIVRCMPNTPALLGVGASGVYANAQVAPGQRELAGHILGAVGLVEWVDAEPLLDAITALSGSGPAYFFLFMEAMINAGCSMGLSRECATTLTRQTALGAARMALESDVDLVELRRRVTSPGGTTERAVECFEHEGLRDLVAHAMTAAQQRAADMAADSEQETP